MSTNQLLLLSKVLSSLLLFDHLCNFAYLGAYMLLGVSFNLLT